MRRIAFLALSTWLAATAARADNAVVPALPSTERLASARADELRLDVFINGRDAKVIAQVFRGPDGALSATRAELRQAGLAPPAGADGDRLRLDSLAGLSFRYEEATQSIYFEAPDALLAPHVYAFGKPDRPLQASTSATGAVVNYDAFARTADWSGGRLTAFGGGSLTLDSRFFSPLGLLSGSGVFGTTSTSPGAALRLDTSYQYVDEERLSTVRAGDFIQSSLPWTRPIRMGGLQITHDYSSRPDLVTSPMASVSGSAAVPSSVDVYVNDFKIFTQNLDPGPYRIENLPMVGGNGAATLTTHGVNGEDTTQTVPFFSSSRLLSAGTLQYSAEAGYARLYYGVHSFDYAPQPLASASLRGSLSDEATVEVHAEGGAGLVNGGAGLALNAFQRGVVDFALAGSDDDRARGLQVALGGETAIGSVSIDVSSQRTFGPYGDLAQATTPPSASNAATTLLQQAAAGGVFLSPLLLSASVAPPRALDRVTFTFPEVFHAASLNLTFVNQAEASGAHSRIVSLGLTHSFGAGASAFATAYVDLANRGDAGLFAGLSWVFDHQLTATSQVARQGRATGLDTEIGKAGGQDIGSYGWRVNDQEGGSPFTEADASYVTPFGKATASANRFGSGASAGAQASADFAGSVSALGGAVELAPTVPDSFALVDAGAPGVSVLRDNRVIGATDASGKLLVAGLRGYEDNRLAIDPTTLPLDAQAGSTELDVRPRGRSGVVADFRVLAEARDAEVILIDAAGAPLPVGGSVEYGTDRRAVIGYEGRAYLVGLAPHNVLTVRAAGRLCSAAFDYAPPAGGVRPPAMRLACRAAAVAATP